MNKTILYDSRVDDYLGLTNYPNIVGIYEAESDFYWLKSDGCSSHILFWLVPLIHIYIIQISKEISVLLSSNQ